jgi:hypothetical protein
VVDRIEKTNKADYWKIASTHETKEEKKREEKGQSGQEQRDSFGETSDFIQLLAKDPRKFKGEKIATTQIKGFTFRGVSTHRDKALLEVDISFANGTFIKGAQIAISRQEGMRYISRRTGEELVVDQIVRGTFLTVAIPQKENPPSAKKYFSSSSETEVRSPQVGFSWSYFLGLAGLVVAILLLLYIFWTL